MSEINIYSSTLPITDFVNQTVGTFDNSIFYDLTKLFAFLTFMFFCYKILGIFFRRKY